MATQNESKIRWLPLESNPDVMNSFLSGLGLPPKWEVTDVYGLDPELLAMIPQPVAAVMLLYPLSDKAREYIATEDKRIQSDGQDVSSNVYYMKQTIGNACGTVALMHALANNQQLLGVESGPLAEFFQKTKSQTPAERAASLEQFDLLAAAHEAACHEGQTSTPSREDKVTGHFIVFVHVDGCLYELDGRRAGPVNHGPSSRDTFLSDAAKVVKSFMTRDPSEVDFSVQALASAQ